MKKIISVVGARPNFVKIAAFANELKKFPVFSHFLVHTGQHYDQNMSQSFFKELAIPYPDINLEVKEESHARQTARVMERFEPICLDYKPDLVVVVGDVNSTLAATLTAVKLGIKVAHIEAGLRSFDRSMPEEINRMLTDTISHYLFITEPSARQNLRNEGIPEERIFFVGNTMIDTLVANQANIAASTILDTLHLEEKKYTVLTLHRPANIDNKESLAAILQALEQVAQIGPIIFPVHPRTMKQLHAFQFHLDFLKIVQPMGYLDFLKLVKHSRFVLTDSGGIQEETTFLGVPCLTLRQNTERPITVENGTNTIIGTDPAAIKAAVTSILNAPPRKRNPIQYWDGKTSQRIVNILIKEMNV